MNAYKQALLQSEAPTSTINRNFWQDRLLAGHRNENWQVMEQLSQLPNFEPFFKTLGPSWMGRQNLLDSEQE